MVISYFWRILLSRVKWFGRFLRILFGIWFRLREIIFIKMMLFFKKKIDLGVRMEICCEGVVWFSKVIKE